MTQGELFVRPARPDEVEVVLALLNDAATWLLARGIEQWHPGQWRAERIAAAIARGETHLMLSHGLPVATVSLEWRDEFMWPDAEDDAGYVHRLAVATREHGRELGARLLTWAERQIAQRPRRFARLDCACDNAKLREYYERAGYRHRGDRIVRGGGGDEFCGILYEKQLA